MRLFNVHSLQLESFFGKELPRYAILSHRWGPDDEELTFRDVQAKNLDKPGIGAVKLRGCITRAKDDKIDYIWVDTFCINKADDATELTKAINSMFAWYQAAAVCYVYLCDVEDAPPLPETSRFEMSQWFCRGWTLQELLAPRQVLFFNCKWHMLGSKQSLSAKVEKATGISAGFHEGVWRLEDASIAQRMSWAAGRITKEPEDVAYSLLGIFGVNMPLIYGEGVNAFIRLQEEIAKKLLDDSILAWGMSPSTPVVEEVGAASLGSSRGILASSPADFVGSGNIVFYRDTPPMHWSSGSGSLGIEMALCTNKFGQIFGLLHCHAADDSGNVPSALANTFAPPGVMRNSCPLQNFRSTEKYHRQR
ncbi:heterokaryon incompatibility protein-domain-containing protein [Plectosphaerella plurivora]|uniref:Heterokaryon incompatibility protein-domain-containing protein n=1 Tax=Plectosphaerella plurivora TaxID=936078 RepID=A0A9P8V195_9PEZI|nr:heterokaryon incompatibility protein-domain-containing protein [Plectosphaerella plurivora]